MPDEISYRQLDKPRVEAAVRECLAAIGEDPDREGLHDTPDRVVRACEEIFGGMQEDPSLYLLKQFHEPSHETMVIVKDIPFKCMSMRGIKVVRSKTVTSDVRGFLKTDLKAREEVLRGTQIAAKANMAALATGVQPAEDVVVSALGLAGLVSNLSAVTFGNVVGGAVLFAGINWLSYGRERWMYALQTEAGFDSAHFLTDYYGTCENLHGHRWRIVVTIVQNELQTAGTMRDMVLDFGEFKRAVREVANSLDHTFLVEEGSLTPATLTAFEAEGFSLTVLPFRTTAENLARYVAEQLTSRGLPVSEVECDETPNNRAFWRA